MSWSEEEEKSYLPMAEEYNRTGGKGFSKAEADGLAMLAKRRAAAKLETLNKGSAPTMPVAPPDAPAPTPVNTASMGGGGFGQAIAQAVGLAPDRSTLGPDGRKLVPTPDPAAVATPSDDPVFAQLEKENTATPGPMSAGMTPEQALKPVVTGTSSSGSKTVKYGKPVDEQLIKSTELLNEKYNKLAVDEGKIQEEAERLRAENAIANAQAIAESAQREFKEKEKIQKRMDDQEKVVQASIAELDKTVVDPSRYMSSRNAWQRFSTMMGAVLGGALEGWTNGAVRDNTFQILQQRIDADIEAQKANLANKSNVVAQKKSVLGFLRQRLGDPALAENILRQQINRKTALMADAIGAQSNSDKVKINVEKFKLDREKELIALKAQQNELAQNKVTKTSNYGQQTDLLGNVLPKIDKAMKTKEPPPQKLNSEVEAGQSARAMLAQLAEEYRALVPPEYRLGGKALVGGKGDVGKFWGILSTSKRGLQFLNNAERASRELGHFGEVGALQDGEVEPYKNSLLIRSPSHFADRFEGFPQALADAEKWISTKMSAKLNAQKNSYDISGHIVSEAQSRRNAAKSIQTILDMNKKE